MSDDGPRPPRQLHLSDVWAQRSGSLPHPIPGSLADAQAAFDARLNKGSKCPCCGRHGQRYRRTLNGTMSRQLIWMVRVSGSERRWVNLSLEAPGWFQGNRQHPTMRFWHLIERQPLDPAIKKKKNSAIWRPTLLGRAFVMGKAQVPKRVHEYKGRPESWSGPRIGIVEALGEKFNYYELMGWAVPVPGENE